MWVRMLHTLLCARNREITNDSSRMRRPHSATCHQPRCSHMPPFMRYKSRFFIVFSSGCEPNPHAAGVMLIHNAVRPPSHLAHALRCAPHLSAHSYHAQSPVLCLSLIHI